MSHYETPRPEYAFNSGYRTEHYDGLFTHVVMACSLATEFLLLDHSCGVAHILYWDWYIKDYCERYVNLSDVTIAKAPAGFSRLRVQA